MRRILVIDDDPAVGHATQLLLEREGFEVVVAKGGRAGIVAAREQRFAVVLVDIFMPDMDGLETIKALRAIDAHQPVVAISGALSGGPSETPDFLNVATKLWGIKTLHKPFRRSDLVQIIEEALASNDSQFRGGQEGEQSKRGATA
jgi:DNA-binding NtrC family response regulator